MLKIMWRDEIIKWFPDKTIEVVKNGKHVYGNSEFFIMSYEMVKNCEVIPTVVIMDECHYVKNLKAKRTQKVHEFIVSSMPKYFIPLSGTPIKNSAIEFYSILKLLSYCPSGTNGRKVSEKSQYAFNIRFSYPRTQIINGPNGPLEITKFEGVRNIERLKGYLRGKYIRRLTKNVLDLPKLIEKDIVLEKKSKGKELKEAYVEHEKGEKSEHIMTIKATNALSKVKDTVEYVCNIVDQQEPVVVFTDHVASCKELSERLVAKKLRVGVINGGTPTDRRSDIVEQFQGGLLDVLVATIGAASTGFTLTRSTNLVFNDYSWGYVDMWQAMKRIHRIGQERNCIIHYMLSSEIDQWIKDKVMTKKKLLEEVL